MYLFILTLDYLFGKDFKDIYDYDIKCDKKLIPKDTIMNLYDKFKHFIRKHFSEHGIQFKEFEEIYANPLKQFTMNELPFLRIHFYSMFERLKGLKWAESCGIYEIVSNDAWKEYIPKTAREYKFNTCSWNYIDGWKL